MIFIFFIFRKRDVDFWTEYCVNVAYSGVFSSRWWRDRKYRFFAWTRLDLTLQINTTACTDERIYCFFPRVIRDHQTAKPIHAEYLFAEFNFFNRCLFWIKKKKNRSAQKYGFVFSRNTNFYNSACLAV